MRLQLPLSKGACTATQRNTAQANTYFPRALEQESCNHLSAFSASESKKKMLLSGGFGFQNWTVFAVLNWGLLGLKKDPFLGPKNGPR